MTPKLTRSWSERLEPQLRSARFAELQRFVARERELHAVFPPERDVLSALERTPFERVSVVLLGQDPYHDVGQAHGLCFSVRPGTKPPPSLVNVFKELRDDLGCAVPRRGDLSSWADQGVLMLNAVLTVRAHEPGSHRRRGWEEFTDAILACLHERPHVVFLLWGKDAQAKAKGIDLARHTVIESAHPSPLSARKFFGSRPFSRANAALRDHGQPQIDWRISES